MVLTVIAGWCEYIFWARATFSEKLADYIRTRPMNITEAQPLNMNLDAEHISRPVQLSRKWLLAVRRRECASLSTNNIDLINVLPPPMVVAYV